MIISVNWLKKFTTIDMPVSDLAQLIGERLVEIEQIIDLGARYKGIVIARVVKVKPHPDADKLSVVMIDDGGRISNVTREDNGLIQVVCGAPNVRAGMLVAWIPPSAVVPATATDPKPVVLEARELRGIVSNGMLGSGKELVINNDHQTIIEIEAEVEPGQFLTDHLELNDYLLDIENKSLTHRPDCFGIIGFAREVAAIMGKPFKSPDWLLALEPQLAEKVKVSGIHTPVVTVEDSQLCPRYEAVVIAGVDSSKASPLVIQSYLKRLGIRPVSAVVDVTNYLMVTTGQPLHAFDYDSFMQVQSSGDTPKISVRPAKESEQLKLLDGRTIKLTSDDIVICAGEKPVGLAGVMGGSETEINHNTKNILLESATFNLYNIRSTSMRHGIFTDAVMRFTKGQQPSQTAPVLASAVRMLCDIGGGVRASDVIDVFHNPSDMPAITVSLTAVNRLLGADLSMQQVKDTLINIEATVSPDEGDTITVLPPYWRADLHIEEDIIEEVGRINGFDSIRPTLPLRPYAALMPQPFDRFRSAIRNNMVRMGANEVLTYSFVPGKLLVKARQAPSSAFRIVNAISPQLQIYRTSLTPSLLDKVQPNIKLGFEKFVLFEMNKIHIKGLSDAADNNLPLEKPRLAMVVSANQKAAAADYSGSPYYQAKYYLDDLLINLKVEYSVVSLADLEIPNDDLTASLIAPFELRRSAAVVNLKNQLIGIVGEYQQSVVSSFKLPGWCAGFEVALDEAFAAVNHQSSYEPLFKFPGTEQDICLRLKSEITYKQLLDVVTAQLQDQPYKIVVRPIDIYQKTEADSFKQITLRIGMHDPGATITTAAASAVIETIAQAARNRLGAEVV